MLYEVITDRFEYFFEPDHDTIVDVACGTDRHIKIKCFVIVIRTILPHIERYSACPQTRPGKAIGECRLRRQDTDPLGTIVDNAVLQDQGKGISYNFV